MRVFCVISVERGGSLSVTEAINSYNPSSHGWVCSELGWWTVPGPGRRCGLGGV